MQTFNRLALWTPHTYQNNAKAHVLNCFDREGAAGLFLAPGMGKTTITLDVFKELRAAGKAKKMLIIAPLKVAQITWPIEIRKWVNFMDFKLVVLHGPKKAALAGADADIYVVNYDAIPWLVEQRLMASIDIIVFDELSKMKSWTSKRTKALKPFMPIFKYRLGLTGTPMSLGLEDLFAQVYMLDLGKRLGHRITKFRADYFNPPNAYSFKLEPKPGAAEKVFEKLKDLCFCLRAEDWLDLPTEIHNVISLELPDNLRTQYNELRKEAIVELKSMEVITAVNAAALTAKLRQFVSGAVYGEARVVSKVHSIKYDALDELIDELAGSSLFVGYYYQHELAEFKARYPDAAYLAGVSSAKAIEIQNAWNNGDIPLLFGHPNSVGHGLNLQASCNNVCFTSLDFNLDNHQQFIKRISRQGQKRKNVFIHYLIFERTIDNYLQSILAGKAEFQASLLEYLSVE